MGKRVSGVGHRVSQFETGCLDIFCPGFFTLHWARGCPMGCSYCYLQRTFRRLPDGKKAKVYEPREVLRHVDQWLQHPLFESEFRTKTPALLNAGELTDSLAHRGSQSMLLNDIVGRFTDPDGNPHRRVLLLLTKCASKIRFNDLDAHVYAATTADRVIFSMTLNSSQFVKDFERGTPSIEKRLAQLWRAREAGWRIRVRIDPVWRYDYTWVAKRLVVLKPEMITLGSFRFYAQDFKRMGFERLRDSMVKCGDGRFRPKARLQWYQDIADLLPGQAVALCKETMDVIAEFNAFCKRDSLTFCNCVSTRP